MSYSNYRASYTSNRFALSISPRALGPLFNLIQPRPFRAAKLEILTGESSLVRESLMRNETPIFAGLCLAGTGHDHLLLLVSQLRLVRTPT